MHAVRSIVDYAAFFPTLPDAVALLDGCIRRSVLIFDT